MKLIFFGLLLSILMESIFTTIPMTLIFLIILTVVFKKSDIFLIAFLSGLFLDILIVGTLGISSIYFTTIVFLIYSYQKKFEVESINFVVMTSMVSSLFYLFLKGSDHVFIELIFSALLTTISYIVFKKTNKKALKYA